jgi:uncharacterized membrane protein YhdT
MAMSSKGTGNIRQANREAIISLVLYGLFFLWWYFSAYGPGDSDPKSYTFVCGFPSWFFYSCIVGYIGVSVLVWVVVRLFFRDIPLDRTEDRKEAAK